MSISSHLVEYFIRLKASCSLLKGYFETLNIKLMINILVYLTCFDEDN